MNLIDCHFVDRDGVSREQATKKVLYLQSIIQIVHEYLEKKIDDSNILTKTEMVSLLERTSLGSMYEFQDVLN